MQIRQLVLAVFSSVLLFSCVSNKKFKAEQARYLQLNETYTQLQNSLKNCENEKAEANRQKAALQTDIENLNKQIAFLKEHNTHTLKSQLSTNMPLLNATLSVWPSTINSISG